MKKFFILGLILIISSLGLKAQDCFKYFPTKKGTSLEYTNYDKKDKITSTTIRTVVDKRTEAGQEVVDFKVETTPAEADTTLVQNFSVICKDGKMLIDLASLIDESTMTGNAQGMDIEVEGTNVQIPNNPVVGQEIDGGQVKINFLREGEIAMTITSDISNRKVAEIEEITTPAGKFNTFKITYDVLVTMGFIKVKSSVAEWYTEKYGIVKTESYNKKGKLDSYTVLTKIND